ncbi:MAG: hypothetical protein AAF065_07670 [Verrucomicrobiota bacterium]
MYSLFSLELLFGLGIALYYTLVCIAVYLSLRGHLNPMAAFGLSVPLTQALLSFIFQVRILTGIGVWHWFVLIALLVWVIRTCVFTPNSLKDDWRTGVAAARRYPYIVVPLSLLILYSVAQVLLLPVRNFDTLTYHLPRVFLFIQENSFFLENFNRYHQVIFPVGADILFYPFVVFGTVSCTSIFSLSSFLAIGALVYAIARNFSNQQVAACTAFALLSMTGLLLQSVSTKNDILMAAAGMSALFLVIQMDQKTKLNALLGLLILAAYGLSAKTTFLAFIPGLGLLAIIKLKLWKIDQMRKILDEARQKWALVLSSLVIVFILSNIWLFAANSQHYESWTGPESFTERSTQNDGAKGAVANLVRYGFQTLQLDFLSDVYVSKLIGSPLLSKQLNKFYHQHFEPIFEQVGSSRGPFSITWVPDENMAWFGPISAILLFICLPIAFWRSPKQIAVLILPPVVYLLIISIEISWMINNSRFFTLFFLSLAPAMAVTLDTFNRKWVSSSLIAIASLAMLSIKLTDFQNPIIKISKESLTHAGPFTRVLAEQSENYRWGTLLTKETLHEGDPETLLLDIPEYSTVALYTGGHNMHYGYYLERPDLYWVPMDRIRDIGKIEIEKAIEYFSISQMDYLLVMGHYSEKWEPFIIARSSDDFSLVLARELPEAL